MKTTSHVLLLSSAVLVAAMLIGSTPLPATAGEFTLATARAAAVKGDPQAEYFLADCYMHGRGVPRDPTNAIACLRKAANQEYVPALTALGSCYAHGQGVAQSDAEAVHLYYRAAKKGDPLAEFCVGLAYRHGKGAPRDMKLAVTWWLKAAKQGQVNAQSALGEFYLHGEYPGDTNHVDLGKAAHWFRKAAEQGYAPAMGNLGYMYLYGVGVEHDFSQALRWNRRAAKLGDALGQDNLGQMYENGNAGLPKDLVQAYKWFWLSQQQGCSAGRHDVIEVDLHHVLTPEQKEKAKRMAAEFQAELPTNRLADVLKPGSEE